MEYLMSSILRKAQISGSPYNDSHSCHRFLIPEELRPQELSASDTEKYISTPPRKSVPYIWLVSYSTPKNDISFSTLSASPSPISSYSSASPSTSPNRYSYDYEASVKREIPSPTHQNTASHPFSVDALVGDVINRNISSESTKPAEIFSSVLLNEQREKIIIYQSQIANLCSQNLLNCNQNVVEQQIKPVYWCHVCNSTCVNKDDVQRHRVIHITKGDKCRLRTTLFKEHGCVTVHEKVDDERIQCGLCNKIVSQCFFSKHQRLHEGHFCDECGKEFSTNSRLQDHKNSHIGITPFTCTICDRQFAKRSSWTQHQRYHRDHRSFECQFCKKRFNSKYACAVHERLHTGENPFKCDYSGCSRSYPQKIQLKLHMNTHR